MRSDSSHLQGGLSSVSGTYRHTTKYPTPQPRGIAAVGVAPARDSTAHPLHGLAAANAAKRSDSSHLQGGLSSVSGTYRHTTKYPTPQPRGIAAVGAAPARDSTAHPLHGLAAANAAKRD